MPGNIPKLYQDSRTAPLPVTDSFDWITSLASLTEQPSFPLTIELPVTNTGKSRRPCSRYILIAILLLVFSLGGAWQIGLGAYIHAKAVLAQILLEAAWADTLNGHDEVKPWPWADTWPISRLTVPRLGISRIVLAGANGASLAFGPGLFSVITLTGNDGNTVIAGHRDTHFRFLKDLNPGDVITLQTPDALLHDYRIIEVKVIHESDTYYLADTTGEASLTLVTCYPFEAIVPGGPLRYIVIARQSASDFHSLLL